MSNNKPNSPKYNDDTGVLVKKKTQTRKPSMYQVVLLNDDYTPMDFVVQILEVIFNKSHQESTQIMLEVHNSGSGICGVYSYEIAETKVAQVLECSMANQHPLQCKMEKV